MQVYNNIVHSDIKMNIVRIKWTRGRSDLNGIVNPKNSDLGLIRIRKWVRIHSDSKSRIDSDSDGFIFNRIISNEIKNFFPIDSDEFGLARKQISE